jgi:signal transduction histidine kinase/ActR/RegA family two-component response regulator
MIKVFIMNGSDKGLSYDLRLDSIYLGRSPENDIRITDHSVSRKHLKISSKQDNGSAFLIEDLKSTNGTFVDGKPIKPGTKVEVKAGLPIAVGNILLSLGKLNREEELVVRHSIDVGREVRETGVFYRPITPAKNLELMYKVAGVLVQSLNIHETLERILDYIFELLGRTDRGTIILRDEETGEISEVTSRSRKGPNKGATVYSRTIVDRVMGEGKAVMLSDTRMADRSDLSASMELMKIKSVMCVPLISRSQTRGVIYVDSVGKPYGFRKEDLSLLTALSSPAAIAIENSLLYSRREQTEAALKKARDELEDQVARRTSELSETNELLRQEISERKELERQLLQAQKMEAIGTLAGGIAHDFNNLLMGVQGNVSLMLLDVDSASPLHPRLKHIEQYVHNGAALTKQLLGFARGGKYEVEPTDLNELLRKSSEMFGQTNKEIKIHRDFEADVWSADVDQTQLEQVLLNLFVNALQAMPRGGELDLRTENVVLAEQDTKGFDVSTGRYVKLSVADTGIGMDAKTQERIFDPFFTTKELGRGTGLGLASAYGIIKNHGGMIQVTSEKGQGATFTIYLPASGETAVTKPAPTRGALDGTEKVLLVDDEEMIIEVGAEMLKSLHYDVLTAKSGQRAVEIYREKCGDIDVVILDLVMPGMGGREIYEQMKAINPCVKVLLSSGCRIDNQSSEVVDLGWSGYLQKPFDLNELSHKMREVLDDLESLP